MNTLIPGIELVGGRRDPKNGYECFSDFQSSFADTGFESSNNQKRRITSFITGMPVPS